MDSEDVATRLDFEVRVSARLQKPGERLDMLSAGEICGRHVCVL